MTEPRTRPRRPNHNPPNSTNPNSAPTSTTFPPSDLSELLYAYASNPPHLQTTITLLDEILTDFIIETCHLAALSASYSRRTKLKVEDFKFVLRHDERLLGRSMEHIWRDKYSQHLVDIDAFESKFAKHDLLGRICSKLLRKGR